MASGRFNRPNEGVSKSVEQLLCMINHSNMTSCAPTILDSLRTQLSEKIIHDDVTRPVKSMYPTEDEKIDLEMEIYNRVILCAPKHQRELVLSKGLHDLHRSKLWQKDSKLDVKSVLPMNDAIEVKLELGHKAILKTGYNPEGYTHDWKLFVRGPEGCNIQHFIEKVVFHLHSTFPRPKRVIKEPPYEVQECGYASFHVPIDIYFKNKNEPKKLQFMYDLFLRMDEQVNHIRCEKLTFQNPTDDFRKRLLLSGGVSRLSPASDTPKDGSSNGKKSPGQSSALQTTPKPAPPVADTPESRAFTDLFGPADVVNKKPKKKSSEMEKSSITKSSKTEAGSSQPKPSASPSAGSSDHSNKVIDLTLDKGHNPSSGSSSSSSKPKQSDKSRSSSSHKDSKNRHSSESNKSISKVPSEKTSDSQDRLHPSSAERKKSHECRSGSHEKQQHGNRDNRSESREKQSKSQDRLFSSHDRRSGSYEKHSQSSSEKKPSSHEKHNKSSENPTFQEKQSDKSSSSQERQSLSHDTKAGSHEKHSAGSSKVPSHQSQSSGDKSEKSHGSLSKSSYKRSAEDVSSAHSDHVLKKKKKKDREKEREFEKEGRTSKESGTKEKIDKKERDMSDKKSSKDRLKHDTEEYRGDRDREKYQDYKAEKEKKYQEYKAEREKEKSSHEHREKVKSQEHRSDREKSRESRGDDREKDKAHKYQKQKSVEKKSEKREDKREGKHEKSDRKDERAERREDRIEDKLQSSKKDSECRKSSKEGVSGKDKKKSKSKEEVKDTFVLDIKEEKEDVVVSKKTEKESKLAKEERKTGKKRKKGYEDLGLASSDSDASFVDSEIVERKKKKKHSHRSKSYSNSQTKKKSISEIYTDSDEDGEIKEGSVSPKNVKVKSEKTAVAVSSKGKSKKRSRDEGFNKETKSRKDVMKDLFSSSDEEESVKMDEVHQDVKEVIEVMDEESEREDKIRKRKVSAYSSESQSDSEDETKLSDIETKEFASKTVEKSKVSSVKKSEKPPKTSVKTPPVTKEPRSLFSNDIFSTGELSDEDPFGDNLVQNIDDSKVEASNSFKENTKPLDKLLSEIDTGSDSSMDDDDILSPIEHPAPLFSSRKPQNVSKSPQSKNQSQPTPASRAKSPKSQPHKEIKEEKRPDPIRSVHLSASPFEKHRSPAARGGKGPKNTQNIKQEESRVDVQKEVVSMSRGSHQQEKGSIIANKSPKVLSDVVKPASDIDEELDEDSPSENDDNESVSSDSSSSSAESGENSESEASENGEDERDDGELESETKDCGKKEDHELGKESMKDVVKSPGRASKNGAEIEKNNRIASKTDALFPSPRGKDKKKSIGDQKFESEVRFTGGEDNNIRRSDTGIFGEFLNNADLQPVGNEEKTGVDGRSSKKKAGSPSGGAVNVARVEPLVRDNPVDIASQRKDCGQDSTKSSSPPKAAGTSDVKTVTSKESSSSGPTENLKGKTSGSTGDDVRMMKAPNGECLQSLLNLQKKLYGIMSNRELLNSIIKIIMKDDTFYSISDTTFDFDLCRLDKSTLNKIQGFLQTTN